jgi:hypothetical protein
MTSAPPAVKTLAILLFLFGIFALLGSLFLWGEGFILQFPEGVDLSYPAADILVNAPASLVAAIGLWRLKRYGYVAAQVAAGLYLYASVEIFAQALQGELAAGPEILLPQALAVAVALGLIFYLWKVQHLFSRPERLPGPENGE